MLSVISKCYTSILGRRLERWAETNGKFLEEQAGFRKSYSTIDHIFLYSVVEKYLVRKGGRLYVAFVDFKKAFDYVNRSMLWSILYKSRVRGRMLRALQAIYKSVKACVRANGKLSEPFICPSGVKQGENSSTILFSFFINELGKTTNRHGRHRI